MKSLKILLIIFLLIIAAMLGFLGYSGFFTSVEVYEKEMGPYNLVGMERHGSYNESKIYMDSVYYILKDIGIDAELGFGIYRDDPQQVVPEKCRSMLGYIVSEEDLVKSVQIQRHGLLIQKMGKTPSIVVDFPMKNPISIFAVVCKVYPKMKDYAIDNQCELKPFIEVYDQSAQKMTIFMEK